MKERRAAAYCARMVDMRRFDNKTKGRTDHMASAINVATYLIHRAEREDEPEYLSHLRLQKLL